MYLHTLLAIATSVSFCAARSTGEANSFTLYSPHSLLVLTRVQDGARYVGDWKENVASGQGKLTWRNGIVYDGSWADGVVRHLYQYLRGKNRHSHVIFYSSTAMG